MILSWLQQKILAFLLGIAGFKDVKGTNITFRACSLTVAVITQT
jgi:hypothetical protein